MGPIGPVGPVGPVTPVTPMDPIGPTGPVGPVDPIGPVAPVAPRFPFAPLGPVGPVGPLIIKSFFFIVRSNCFITSSKFSQGKIIEFLPWAVTGVIHKERRQDVIHNRRIFELKERKKYIKKVFEILLKNFFMTILLLTSARFLKR
jgi:hypothetical protein